MRCVAGVGWLLLVGCNRIFGITATQPWDAPPDVVPDLPHVVLTWQLATTSTTGAPSPALEYPPFAAGAAPQIRIAPIDRPFMPAAYLTSPGKEGWIEIPRDYFAKDASGNNQTWRLEYTLPADVPHEVQWAPDDKIAHLTVPMVGRLDRQPVPDGSGYAMTPTSPPGSYTFPRLFTTGLWTDGPVNPPSSGTTVDYDFFNAVSLSGAKGSPDPAHGDRGFLVDFATDPDGTGILCRVAVGSAALTSVALTAKVHTAQSVVWDTSRTKVTTDVASLDALTRLTTGLGKLNTMLNDAASTLVFGVIPSTSFPGLTGSSLAFALPTPVMQTLLQCPQGRNGPADSTKIPATSQPVMLGDFPTAVHVQLVDSRQVLGVVLSSGMETLVGASAGGGFRLEFPAAIPTQMTLTTPGGGKLDLAGDSDQLAAGSPTGAFVLDFVPEAGTDLRADYYDVLLHRIAAGELTTERIFTVTAPRVRIDGALLVPGADYVFEIRSFKGHIAASRGDFAPVDYPYGSAVVFTRTFKTA